ncbi:type IV secretion system protein [Luteibacter aegosomatis]|uniref:type IV secretion system protein n=1 Tax=Luteibacter aegosomatis TaxID=2911537 RepID=UPI001FF8E63D|nr:type IV secretion system protein [Luteibacter aegosomatis]UPG84674.1 type IV secretion system protein [Luteibacter aegosomatis]
MIDRIGDIAGTPALALAGDPTGALTNFFFFSTINDFLRNEIDVMQWKLLSGAATIIGTVAVVVLTVWIMWQGFRIVSGQSRQPMMALVGDSAKATLIVFIATTAAASSSSVYWTLSDGMSTTIAQYVTGDTASPFESIDKNLAQMEVALAIIDSMDTGKESAQQDAKDRNRWFTGIGVAGPSVVAGSMLLLNKIALALFVGFGPFFIMCLLFDSTKALFQKWLLYGIGTVFSLAVLSVMVGIAMKMMGAITEAFAAKFLMTMATGGSSSSADGINSMALQQGGVGLLLSTLIIMAPPMAAAFFQGTLGQFASYSSFGSIGSQIAAQDAQALAQGRSPMGGGGYVPPHRDQGGTVANTGKAPTLGYQGGPSVQPKQDDTVKNQRPTGLGETP